MTAPRAKAGKAASSDDPQAGNLTNGARHPPARIGWAASGGEVPSGRRAMPPEDNAKTRRRQRATGDRAHVAARSGRRGPRSALRPRSAGGAECPGHLTDRFGASHGGAGLLAGCPAAGRLPGRSIGETADFIIGAADAGYDPASLHGCAGTSAGGAGIHRCGVGRGLDRRGEDGQGGTGRGRGRRRSVVHLRAAT